MQMELVKKELHNVVDLEKVPVEEYQDKYYFLKRIKRIFPELSNEKIANAINYANNEVKVSGRKKKYINALSLKIFFA